MQIKRERKIKKKNDIKLKYVRSINYLIHDNVIKH